MSGSDIAYHLRPNKAIDRNLFIALLERVGRVRNISDYEYIGFGGPMLEDYKALHAALRISHMHSIEFNEDTYKRQKFNRPSGFIKLHSMESGDFFRSHEFSEKGSIVWLDYTQPRDLKSQLDEFLNVASMLDCHDVIKITLNANVAALGDTRPSGEKVPPAELPGFRLGILKERLGAYVPPDLEVGDLVHKKYPLALQRCLRHAVGGLSARAGGKYFQILSSFYYADGQTMLTVTGIIVKAPAVKAIASFKRLSRIGNWPFANLKWSDPMRIAVPALTAKERMHVDEVLPYKRGKSENWKNRLEKHLGYPIGAPGETLGDYAQFYRVYPHFSRIIL